MRLRNVQVTDAKEVGVGNPAEETFYHPDAQFIAKKSATVKPCCWKIFSARPNSVLAATDRICPSLLFPANTRYLYFGYQTHDF